MILLFISKNVRIKYQYPHLPPRLPPQCTHLWKVLPRSPPQTTHPQPPQKDLPLNRLVQGHRRHRTQQPLLRTYHPQDPRLHSCGAPPPGLGVAVGLAHGSLRQGALLPIEGAQKEHLSPPKIPDPKPIDPTIPLQNPFPAGCIGRP